MAVIAAFGGLGMIYLLRHLLTPSYRVALEGDRLRRKGTAIGAGSLIR